MKWIISFLDLSFELMILSYIYIYIYIYISAPTIYMLPVASLRYSS